MPCCLVFCLKLALIATLCIGTNDPVLALASTLFCGKSYVQRSPLHAGGADKPGHGTGTWISEEPQMTLTYRGQKYDQKKVAGTSTKSALTYRGISYAK